MTGLPPTMDAGAMKDFLMQDLDGLDREIFDPIAERAVDGIFADRGNPRTIVTPLAIVLAKRAIREMGALHG